MNLLKETQTVVNFASYVSISVEMAFEFRYPNVNQVFKDFFINFARMFHYLRAT